MLQKLDTHLKVGLIGFGLSGRYFHAPFLKVNPRLRLTKVVERSTNEAILFDPSLEIVRSPAELLADPAIDLVFICTPNHTHFEYAKAALEAGKHVVVEKPFANTLAEAEALMELAERKKLFITAYQNRRWDADFLTIQALLQTETLGQIVEVESHFDRYRPQVPQGTWKELPMPGAGNLYNLGPHLIDQVLTLFGPPKTVTATIKTTRTNALTDDYFDIRLDYTDKRIALKSSLLAYKNDLRFLIHGTQGSFVKKGLDVQEDLLRQGMWPNQPNWGAEPSSQWGKVYSEARTGPVESQLGNYTPFYDNLYEVIVNAAEPLVKPYQILQTTRTIDRALASNQLQKTVEF
ncbi:MAG: oxidoreductase [Cytophagia bacterium]|nr:MAG: oxidoreductase [Cytophagales bacterium]TAG40385.1 MAG: oxidoreductase [Cytophagia bacterium]TAG61131.1 MAG: oxidoreductase [Runella slithyformis]TAG77249.1 MAG: oxidoreductase [Cytophagales bacterium]